MILYFIIKLILLLSLKFSRELRHRNLAPGRPCYWRWQRPVLIWQTGLGLSTAFARTLTNFDEGGCVLTRTCSVFSPKRTVCPHQDVQCVLTSTCSGVFSPGRAVASHQDVQCVLTRPFVVYQEYLFNVDRYSLTWPNDLVFKRGHRYCTRCHRHPQHVTATRTFVIVKRVLHFVNSNAARACILTVNASHCMRPLLHRAYIVLFTVQGCTTDLIPASDRSFVLTIQFTYLIAS